jgi:RND family efflux transporter MFP subunit
MGRIFMVHPRHVPLGEASVMKCNTNRIKQWPRLICCSFLALAPAVHAGELTSASFDCVIEPQQVVKLSSSMVGVVAELNVDRGDVVRRGQFLGKLEDGLEKAGLALAEARARNEYSIRSIQARLEFLTQKHRRATELLSKSIMSTAAVEEVAAERKMSEQQLKEAELNLEVVRLDVIRAREVVRQRELRSPVDGVVMERLLVPGEYRNEQSPILTLAQIDPLRVEVIVPITHYGRIRTDSIAKVQPEQPVGGEYDATVAIVDRVLDASSGTFGVRLALRNRGLTIPAGIRCRVAFEMDSNQRPASVAKR